MKKKYCLKDLIVSMCIFVPATLVIFLLPIFDFGGIMMQMVCVVYALIISLIIGGAVAAIFGIIIGLPALRLRGDYLAIVTLAFGEIIKTIVNALYIGKDADGFHVALDSSNLNLATDGQIILKGPQGITGTPKNSTFFVGIVLILIYAIYRCYA